MVRIGIGFCPVPWGIFSRYILDDRASFAPDRVFNARILGLAIFTASHPGRDGFDIYINGALDLNRGNTRLLRNFSK